MALQDYLYTQSTVPEVLKQYIRELRSKENDVKSLMHANKLVSYADMMHDKQFLKDLRKLFNETYDLMDKNHPSLHFSIAGRRKSLISTEKKILQYSSMDKSLDLIRDFFAFRIILFGDKEINLVKHCYSVMEEIIEFSIKKGYTPCESLPLIDSSNVNENAISDFKYEKLVKDYIRFPKKNGYKSMHLVLVDTKGRHFEIQVLTLDMYAQNESGTANHNDYKYKKYNIPFPLERKKITVNGYTFVNEELFDYAGVEKPIIIFQRQKTF